MRRLAPIVLAALVLAACGRGDEAPETTAAGPVAEGFDLSSSDVPAGGVIPAPFTCDGDDISPSLSWSGAPAGTATLALVLEDVDAPGGTFTHWLLWDLPETMTSLAAGLPPGASTGAGEAPISQGTNDFGEIGYGGPCPPEGEEHRYVFRLFAIDATAELPEPGAEPDAFEAAADGHLVAEARLEATYARGG